MPPFPRPSCPLPLPAWSPAWPFPADPNQRPEELLRHLCFRNRLPNFPHSPAGYGRAFEHFSGVVFAESAQALMPFFLILELVNLGDYYHVRAIVELQPIPQFDIPLHPSSPGVQQDHRQLQSVALQHVPVGQLFPLLTIFLGDLGVSISWQIDEPITTVNLVEIDQLSTTWPGTGECQLVGPHQRIQQAGFADITAAQEGDLS